MAKTISKLKVNTSSVKLFFLLLPIFRPSVMTLYAPIVGIYNVLTFFVFVYLIVDFVITSYFDIFTCSIFFLELYIFLVTFINKGANGLAIYRLETILILALLTKKYSNNNLIYIKTLLLHFEICIYANFATMLLKPDGFFDYVNNVYSNVGIKTAYWVLGVANNFIVWFIPGLICAWIYKTITKRNVRYYILTIVIISSLLIKNSSTCSIGCFLFLFLVFSYKFFPYIKELLKPVVIVPLCVFLFIIIVLLQQSNFLKPIIENVLGKDLTFSNRLTIWDNAITAFLRNPVWGYGLMENEETAKILGRFPNFIWAGATHCHDEILQILFTAGLIGLFVYLLIWILSIYTLSSIWKYDISKYIFFGCVSIFVIGLTEITEYALLYFPLFYGYWYAKNFKNKGLL